MLRGFIGDIIGSYFEGVQWTTKTGDFFDLNHPINFILPEQLEKRKRQSLTDDSICTLGLYKAFLDKKRGDDAALCLADFCKNYPDVGFGKRFKEWIENPVPYNSFANGAIMRLGFLHMVPKEERFPVAVNYTLISHNHEESIEAVLDYVEVLNNLGDKNKIKELIIKRGILKSVEDYHNDAAFLISSKDTFDQVLVILNESSSFEEVLRNALYIGGDTDTLACISCSLTNYEIPEELFSYAKNEVISLNLSFFQI